VVLAAAVARMRQRALFLAWHAWQGCIMARRVQMSRALAVLQRMQHVKLAAALASWRHAAAAAAAERQLALRAVDFFVGSRQRLAFETWRSNVAEGRAEAVAVRHRDSLLLLQVGTPEKGMLGSRSQHPVEPCFVICLPC